MAWTSDQLNRIGDAEELEITSYRSDGTLRRWVTIWAVRVGDGVYVRSVFGTDGGWYRNAIQSGAARIRVSDVETDVTLESVRDASVDDEVSDAYRAKYHSQPSDLRPILEPVATQTTTRLRPS
jgi:hypothetical protein